MIMAEVDWSRLFPILENAVQMLFVLGILALCVWAGTRKTRLKNKMIERGLTAEEIEEVMNAGRRR